MELYHSDCTREITANHASHPISAADHHAEMGSLPVDLEMTTSLQEPIYPTVATGNPSGQDCGYYAQSSPEIQYAVSQTPEQGCLAASCDVPMSFRDRHRFLDSVYNSYSNPDEISAKNLENISRRAGLLMEEVLSWFEDEKIRRFKLLASKDQYQQKLWSNFPPSPESSTTSGLNNTVTMTLCSQNPSSPKTIYEIQDTFSTHTAPSRSMSPAGRRPTNFKTPKRCAEIVPESPSPAGKRQKTSIEYPCVDCHKYITVERWPEHIKRVHFPDFVWECPKTGNRTGNRCDSKPFFRPDNFVTHLRGEHECEDLEISRLKVDCKFKVVNFFHKRCGFCEKFLKSRDESIAHIKDHLRKNAEKGNPYSDLGRSSWKERCGSEHRLQRGVHYKVNLGTMSDSQDDNEDKDKDADHNQDDNDDGDSNNGKSAYFGAEKSSEIPDSYPLGDGDGGQSNSDSFISCNDSSFTCATQCQQQNHSSSNIVHSTESNFGLEGLALPFTSLRKLGSGGHGLVDEVACTNSEHTFARKSVVRKQAEQSGSSQMTYLRNELDVLKKLLHPHLVKLIGAYTDDEYSHIIMTPVADQNLADYMRASIREPELYLCWMGCLASAMSYLHEKQVQHLDIKPQNILVQGTNILLADFGTARSFLEFGLPDGDGLAVTPMYCAPETISHGIQDYKTDVFSLGCVFSEMLTRYSGHSLEEYEQFRSTSTQKSFHSTLLKTRKWVESLMSNIIQTDHQHRKFEMLSSEIMGMLSADSAHRPTSSQIWFFFTQAEHCCSLCSRECLAFDSPPINISKILIDDLKPAISPNEISDLQSKNNFATIPTSFALTTSYSKSSKMAEIPFGSTTEMQFSNLAVDSVHLSHYSEGIDFEPYPSFAQSEERVPYLTNSINIEHHSPYFPNNVASNLISNPYRWPSVSEHGPESYELQTPSRRASSRFSSVSGCYSASINSYDSGYYTESTAQGRCYQPDCGKFFKDLKAHMLTHQNERPEKCPVQTCDYSIKGFARKYDKNRHTLTHYKGTLVCGFCPGSGTAAEKTFNRADVFKRHLTSVHAVEQTPPNSRKKSLANINSSKKLSEYAPDATGKCSTCSAKFNNAQDFYEHLDDCVLRIVQQQEPTEATSAPRVAEVVQGQTENNIQHSNELATKDMKIASKEELDDDDDEWDDDSDDKSSLHSTKSRMRTKVNCIKMGKRYRGLYSKDGKTISAKGRKKRKVYPWSWGYAPSQTQTEMKTRISYAWNEGMLSDTEHRVLVSSGDAKEAAHFPDLNIQIV